MCITVCCRVDQRKQVSVRKKIASLCAADVALKEFAQRVINDFRLFGNIQYSPCDAMHSADCAVARCPFVCPSVTCQYSVKMAKHIVKLFSPLGSNTVTLDE